ncbi:MAG: hypothetical protein LAQ30_14360 [Acidobacteriia bacterium]|nr:hypothetical protein [Terriglobia bacterium]
MRKIQRVLISVTDKTGVVDFARELSALGAELISTGGTARMIRESGVPVKDVSEVTGFPEMLDGRVKTLHPKVAGGILAMRGRPDHMQALAEQKIAPIDMVVVNLYRFEEVAAKPDARLEELIENIDIGGPSMIRAAAKNYQDVAVVVSPRDYAGILDELRKSGGALSHETKWRLAKQAFRTTADYDAAISARLARDDSAGPLPQDLNLRAPKLMDLRYGENPHQSAALYGARGKGVATLRRWTTCRSAASPRRPQATRPPPLSRNSARNRAPSPILGLRKRDRVQPRGGRGNGPRDREDLR